MFAYSLNISLLKAGSCFKLTRPGCTTTAWRRLAHFTSTHVYGLYLEGHSTHQCHDGWVPCWLGGFWSLPAIKPLNCRYTVGKWSICVILMMNKDIFFCKYKIRTSIFFFFFRLLRLLLRHPSGTTCFKKKILIAMPVKLLDVMHF